MRKPLLAKHEVQEQKEKIVNQTSETTQDISVHDGIVSPSQRKVVLDTHSIDFH